MQRGGMAHLPVLVDEGTFLLRPHRGGWVVGGMVGMGGHAERLLERAGPRARLLGLDHDPEALARARQRLSRFGDRVVLTQGSFRHLATHAGAAGVTEADAVLLDLGLSSYQLDESARGFSFQGDEPLDMRFDPAQGPTAAELLNCLPQEELARILFEYGDETQARRIARRIVEQRARAPFATTADLVAVVKRSVPRAAWSRRAHVATRTFEALPQAAALIAIGGRLGVISFHSGEDRIVKRMFRSLEPTRFGELEPSPIEPDPDEVRHNPRARSAKLRVLERLEAA